MATVNHENLKPQGVGADTQLIRWSPLTTTNLDGDWIAVPEHSDITVHVFGTFGAAATLTMQGSNEVVASPTAPATLHDSRGAANDLTFLTAGANAIKQCAESPHRMRPLLSGGDGTTSLTVIAKCVRRK